MITYLFLTLILLIVSCATHRTVAHRVNGWYHLVDAEKGTLSAGPIVTVEDFVALRLENDILRHRKDGMK